MSGDQYGLPAAAQDSDVASGTATSTEDAVLSGIHQVTDYVETLVASWNGPNNVVERRRWHRVPYYRPILVTPLDDESNEPNGPPQLVPGRDISLGGVSFAHQGPLSCRKVACTFDPKSGCQGSVVVKLTWCRFTKEGWYLSGGQFTQPITMYIDPSAFNSTPQPPN